MENQEKIALDSVDNEFKNSMRKMCESLHSQATSFTRQCLEGGLDLIRNWIQTQLEELYEREKQLDAKADEFQEREKQVEAKELKIQSKLNEVLGLEELLKEKQKEVTDCGDYLISLQTSIKEHTLLEKELGDKERETERRIPEFNGVERKVEEKSKKSSDELILMQRKMKEQGVEFDMKEKKMKAKEEDLIRIEKSIEEKLKFQSEEQKRTFDLKEKQIEEREENLNRIKKSVEEKKKLAVEEQKKVFDLKLELFEKERKLKEEEKLKEGEKEHTLKSREEIKRAIELKVKDHFLRKKSMEEWASKLESKERELESKEKHLEWMDKMTLKEFQEREKQLEAKSEALEKLQQERKGKEEQLEVKERQLEEQVKEVELTKKQLGCHMKTRDGTGLQLFMYEHMKRNDSVSKEISALLQQESLEPAKLVLDAMEGFHPSTSREFDLVLIRRTCILLLEELKRASAQVSPQVREEAMKLASDWKAKMKVGNEHWLEVLGFLRLVTTYDLTSAYDADELQSLLDIVAQHEQATELSRALGNKANNISADKAESSTQATSSSPNLQPAATEPNEIIDIQNFITEKKLITAFGRIVKFKLFDKFPPAQVLKEHAEKAVEKAMKYMKGSERKEVLHPRDQVILDAIADLQLAIECIKHHNLESQYPPESIEKQIVLLQRFREHQRHQNPNKRPCSSSVDPNFQQHGFKYQRASLSAERPYSLLPPETPNPNKRPCSSSVDPNFQQHGLKYQRASLSAERPYRLLPPETPNPNPGSSFYNGQFSIPSNYHPVQFGIHPNGANYQLSRIYPYPRPHGYGHPGYGQPY